MLARLYIFVGYKVLIPEGAVFTAYEGEESGYKVRFFPPVRSDRIQIPYPDDKVTLNGTEAFEADVVRIEFHKDKFTYTEGDIFDPPKEVIQRCLDDYHSRLRYVTRASQIKPVSFPWSRDWRIEYSNDDGSPLTPFEGMPINRGINRYEFAYIALNSDVWNKMFTLPNEFDIPAWDGLRLDAQQVLPDVGAAVVLAATALEVFIGEVLEGLRSEAEFSPELWKWINVRGNQYLRQPVVEEQFDVLLKYFTGHSLKEKSTLWEAFVNLKSARNTFAHEGVARTGNRSPLTQDEAQQLLGKVNEIIDTVWEWLPEKLRWPKAEVKVQIGILHKIGPVAQNNTGRQEPIKAGEAQHESD